MRPDNPSAVGPSLGALACAVILLVSVQVHGLTSLMEGNAPLRVDDSPWPGLLAVFNDESRVLYAVGPLTEEAAFYQGDTAALERVLGAFAAVKIDGRVVVLLPGRGDGYPWLKKDSFYDWRLETNPVNPRLPVPEEDRELILPTRPRLTVFVGGAVDLERLRVPPGVTLLGVDDLRAGYRKGLLDGDDHVRGVSAWRLARLDPYSDESAARVEGLPAKELAWSSVKNALAAFEERRADPPEVRAEYEREERSIREFIFAWRYGWLRLAIVSAVIVVAVLLVATVGAVIARRSRGKPALARGGDEAAS